MTTPPPAGRVLTVNGGSSSVKFAIYDAGDPPHCVHRGSVERADSVDWLDALESDGHLTGLTAVGHRVVHGGTKHFDPQLVTPDLLADLRRATPLDPAHLPSELALIEAISRRLPGVPQVVCFDTAFHRDLPAVAKMLPIPREYADAGVHRYGFHGLSYEYLLRELGRVAGAEANGRVVLAHLGNGASLAAVRGGQCIDTTMGFTPTGGLMMGKRSGDLDPGVLIHLMRTEGFTADQLDDLVNRRSGLLGVSGTTSDVREIVARMATDPHAREAFESFCYSVRKGIGAMAAALGGLDTLVFSGGIGENSPEVRAAICDGLSHLGIDYGLNENATNALLLSACLDFPVMVYVIPTDEEVTIARHVFRLLGGAS